MRKRMRFSLHGLFVGIAAVAALLSQYPFIESKELPYISPQMVSTVTIEYRMVHRPTPGFVAVAKIEAILGICWLYWRAKRRRNGNPVG
jgi:hypothetical protein